MRVLYFVRLLFLDTLSLSPSTWLRVRLGRIDLLPYCASGFLREDHGVPTFVPSDDL